MSTIINGSRIGRNGHARTKIDYRCEECGDKVFRSNINPEKYICKTCNTVIELIENER